MRGLAVTERACHLHIARHLALDLLNKFARLCALRQVSAAAAAAAAAAASAAVAAALHELQRNIEIKLQQSRLNTTHHHLTKPQFKPQTPNLFVLHAEGFVLHNLLLLLLQYASLSAANIEANRFTCSCLPEGFGGILKNHAWKGGGGGGEGGGRGGGRARRLRRRRREVRG